MPEDKVEFTMHTCKLCGPKEAYFFAPSELKNKPSYCMKCISQRRKARAEKNPVPGHFDVDYRRHIS